MMLWNAAVVTRTDADAHDASARVTVVHPSPSPRALPGARTATAVVLALYLVFALGLAVLVPPFEAPDEPSHIAYATFIATRGELPNQLDPARKVDGQGHQGPLAYAVMAVVLRLVTGGPLPLHLAVNPTHAWHGGGGGIEVPMFRHDRAAFDGVRNWVAFYLLRILSIAFGFATLLVIVPTVALMTDDEPTRLLAVLLPATLPQYLFVSSYVTADGLLTLLTALAAYATVRVVREPARTAGYVALGIALGAALTAKKTALFLLPGIGVTLGTLVLAGRARLAAVVRGGAVAGLIVAVIAGWLFVRNTLLYGDPLGSAMEHATLGVLYAPRPITDPFFRDVFPRMLGASFVGLLGWMNIWLPTWVYWLYALLGLAAAAGVLRRLRDPWTWIAALFAGLCLVGIVVYNLTFPQPQGRYLFAALPFVTFLAATGLRPMLSVGRSPWHALAVLGAVLVAVDVSTLVSVWSFFRGH
jgi:Predicted membrane protein (DUF2142)